MVGTTEYPNPTEAEAARFLSQATFGATAGEIARLQTLGYGAWFDEQFALPAEPRHQQALVGVLATAKQDELLNSFWKQAVTGPDQLRQRLAFALSQIFVVSLLGAPGKFPDGVASYLDMLGAEAFGGYRQLLESVTRHPMMGLYLSHLGNQKEDPARTRVPDQNFAREVMQLFSIGLYRLEADGSLFTPEGSPVETYGTEDVIGLSRVFTGFSWAGPDTRDGRFLGKAVPTPDPDRAVKPMQAYPKFHSVLEKRFLGVVIPAGVADADGDLRIALDTLAAHPNVGPFLGRQLIQRLVTSNPSRAYVGRVAAAFDTGRFTSGSWSVGSGGRGDLRALVAAVLLDPEARERPPATDTTTGRLREPVLRLANWMRAFNATSVSGRYRLGRTDLVVDSIGQSPLCAPSVFNFYRPGYTPSNGPLADAGLVAPELQITHEASVIGYANYLQSTVQYGAGIGTSRDVKADYRAEIALAHDPDRLIDRIDLLLTGRSTSTATRALIRSAVTAIALPLTGQESARQRRVWTAVLFTLSAPDYLTQK